MAEQRRRATDSRPVGRQPAAAAGRSGPARRAGRLVPLLAVAAGALVLGPQLTPVLVEVTAATGPLGGSTATATATPAAASTTTPVAAARNGSAASAAPPAAVAAQGGLAIPQPPRPQQIVVMPNAAVGTPPSYTQRPDPCGGSGAAPRRMVPGVVAGTGTATLDWMADNRPEVLGYRVQAVSQRLVGGTQPAPVIQTVGQPTGCAPVRVTIAGLTSGVPYAFWLEEQMTSSSTGVTRLVQVGTTGAVVIG